MKKFTGILLLFILFLSICVSARSSSKSLRSNIALSKNSTISHQSGSSAKTETKTTTNPATFTTRKKVVETAFNRKKMNTPPNPPLNVRGVISLGTKTIVHEPKAFGTDLDLIAARKANEERNRYRLGMIDGRNMDTLSCKPPSCVY